MKRRSPIHAYKRLLADDQDWDYAYLIVPLRQQKALHLYHLIREYKLLSWWD